MAGYVERLVRAVWQNHYRIPETAYWASLVIVAAATPLVATDPVQYLLGVAMQGIAVVGIARWHLDRRRCRNALVVAKFREGGGTQGHADEAQRIVIDSLRSRLGPAEGRLAQAIPVTVSGDEKAFAARLARRLRARFVLHGRLAAGPEGVGWSVLPRLLEPSNALVSHLDPFTRDITTMRASFEPVSSSLKPERGVSDDEFPFEFCNDLEVLIRALAGRLAHATGDEKRAIALLRDSLSANPQSTSPAVDSLRIALAEALLADGHENDALSVFRRRMRNPDPSTRLLRHFAIMLWRVRRWGRKSDRELRNLQVQAIRALRQAVQDRSDPEWDISAYNLMSVLSGEPDKKSRKEAARLLDELLESESGYSRAWYVLRERGVRDWRRVAEARKHGDEEGAAAAGRDAARWYGKSLRARPRIRFFHPGPDETGFVLCVRFQQSPILFANLADAHGVARHRVRARWYECRFQRERAIRLRRGRRWFESGDWEYAYANYDWAQVGRHDFYEVRARVYAAVSLQMADREDEADEVWGEALAFDPFALVVRAALAVEMRSRGYEEPLPGGEPLDLPSAVALAEERYDTPIPRTENEAHGVHGYWHGAGRGSRGLVLGWIGSPLFWLSRYPGWRARLARRLIAPLMRFHHRRHPGDLRLRFLLGFNSMCRLDFDAAITYFSAALEAARGDYEALTCRALARAHAGDLDGARADVWAWRDFPPIPGKPGEPGFGLLLEDGERARVLQCLRYGYDEPRLMANPGADVLTRLLAEAFPRGWASWSSGAESRS